jgi:hypothetical protein
MLHRIRIQARVPAASTSLLLLAACGASSGDASEAFVVFNTAHASAAATPPVVGGRWLVYFADEATTSTVGAPTDLNGDGDTIDPVATVVDMRKQETFELGLAAKEAAVLGDQIYVVADEVKQGADLDLDGFADDLVLMNWSKATLAATVVATLDPASATGRLLARIGNRLYVALDPAAIGGPDDTNVGYIEEAAPTSVVTVPTAAGGTLVAALEADEAGLVFLSFDEAANAAVLNGDGDATDAAVLGVVDALDATPLVYNLGLAADPGGAVVGARARDASGTDWTVAFLVNEADQGANLNDADLFAATWLAENCAAVDDADMLDSVLHYVSFAGFVAGTDAPTNTGIAGSLRALALTDFVATLESEMDSGCDGNADGDTDDLVPRWVAADGATPLPPGLIAQLVATADVPGGSHGLAWLGERLIAVVDEAADGRDWDGKPGDHDLVAWLEPADGAGALWTFDHGGNGTTIGTGVANEPFAGASWMAGVPQLGRLPLAYQEEVPAKSLNTNVDCDFVTKDAVADDDDSLPVWADFAGDVLDFDGTGYAVAPTDPGIVLAGSQVYFRVSEADDNTDYNTDGDLLDEILLRNPITTCGPKPMATSSGASGPVVFTDGLEAAALFTSEPAAGVDLNGDGDDDDLVVRYFAFF